MEIKGRIPTLDGLRAVAILIVIASHADHQGSIAQLGHMGVLIFFALSGYLITSRLLDEYRKNGRISLRNFYLRRAFRILPPAMTYLAILSVLVAAGVVVCSWSSILGATFFYADYMDVRDVAGHFWSLSVEEHFYLIWPVLLIACGVKKGLRTALALTLAIVAWRALDHHYNILATAFHNPRLIWNPYGTDAVADALLWGCALSFLEFQLKPLASVSIACAGAVLLALIAMGKMPSGNVVIGIERFLPAVILGAIVSSPQSLVGKLLELRPVRFIGHLSYSLYIWQQIFLIGTKLPIAVGISTALACAYLSYRFIEQPAIALGKRLLPVCPNASVIGVRTQIESESP